MKINFLVRFRNKAFLATFIPIVLTFVYQLLGLFGVTPAISQDNAIQYIGLVINLLAALGIVVDPTTKGLSDSAKALTYTEPN